MPSLNRAFTFEQVDDRPRIVGHDLKLDVTRMMKIAFEIDRGIAETRARLRARLPERSF